jgi:hypothetical protein
MPDLVRLLGHGSDVRRQMIMRIGQDENAEQLRHTGFSHALFDGSLPAPFP